jgi:hypothetical protein
MLDRAMTWKAQFGVRGWQSDEPATVVRERQPMRPGRTNMAKLTVQGTHHWKPLPLNTTKTPVVFSLSVTDDAGNAVEGLKETHIKVVVIQHQPIQGEEVLAVKVTLFAEVPNGAGFYNVFVKPDVDKFWGAGHYDVGVTVARKKLVRRRVVTNSGQTVVTFDVT